MITFFAVIVSLVLMAVKLLADSSGNKILLRIGRLLVWTIVPLVVLFIVSVMVRVANDAPSLPLFF